MPDKNQNPQPNQPPANDLIDVSEKSVQAFFSEPSSDPDSEEAPTESHVVRSLITTVLMIVASLGFAVILLTQILLTTVVSGYSMFPTLNSSDRILLWAAGKSWANLTSTEHIPKRGEVIVFVSNDPKKTDYIKRVVGLPGERVVLKDGIFTIYNDESPEGFNPNDLVGEVLRPASGQVDTTVPIGHIFVSGDNREGDGSFDSRNGLGTVELSSIKGRAVIRFLPITEARFF